MSAEAEHGSRTTYGHGRHLESLLGRTSNKRSFSTMAEGQRGHINDNPHTATNTDSQEWQHRPGPSIYPDSAGQNTLSDTNRYDFLEPEAFYHQHQAISPLFVPRDVPTNSRDPHLNHHQHHHHNSFDSITDASTAATSTQLALPSMPTSRTHGASRARTHFPGDGLDFRRPIMGNGEAWPRPSPVVDLTGDDDGPADTGTAPLDLPVRTEATPSSTRRQGLPRFGRDIIDVDGTDGVERPAPVTGARGLEWPNSLPNSRQPTPPADDEEVVITDARPLQPTARHHRHPTHRSNSFQPRIILPDPARLIDLTEDADDVMITDARQVGSAVPRGINGESYRRRADGPLVGAMPGFEVSPEMILEPPRTQNRAEAFRMGSGTLLQWSHDDEVQRVHPHHDRLHHGHRLHGYHTHGAAGRIGGRAAGLHVRMHAPGGMPITLDYEMVGFDLPIGRGNRPPTPKYSPPPDAPAGFTMNPGEDDVVVCPNCGDELAVGGGTWPGTAGDEVKQQIWVVKKCGHAYCGACATYKAPGAGKGKGKGKEKVLDDAAPPPLRKCVVGGCGQPAGKGSLIHVYLSQ